MHARRSAHAICAIVMIAGCHTSKPETEGAYLGLDERLLIVIDDDDVTFEAVLGDGTCVAVGEGTLEGDEIVFDVGPSLTVDFGKKGLELDDPDDLLSDTYVRVEVSTYCYVNVPAPGALADGVVELTPSAPQAIAGGRARSVSLTVDADVGTLAVYVIGRDVGWGMIEPRRLLDPHGDDLFADAPYLTECGTTFCTVLLPKIPGYEPEPGAYTFEFGGSGDVTDLRVFAVARAAPISGATVRVHVVVGPTDHPLSDIEDAIDGVVAFLAGFGIELVVDPIETSTNPAFASVPIEFLSPRTQALSALGEPDAINVFVVDDLIGLEGIYGIASGIPGTLGVVGPWNGVLVNVTTHENDPTATFEQLVRETIAHEVGHLVGLYHTTESGGLYFDPLVDTPECDLRTFDANMDDEVVADECESVGGDNVMFWTPSVNALPLVPQVVLTDDQVYVYEHVVVGN